ncbi:MAG: hypothetical protein HY738_05905 [Bacteroidia bacterium]|nr:hypothetical protein [Bacteroidia bacterium]
MYKRNIFFITTILILSYNFFCCRQLLQAYRLSECEYALSSVEKFTLAGIPFENISSITDLGFIGVGKKEVFSGESAATILQYALSWSGIINKPTRVTLKIKPVLKIGNRSVKSPGFITVKIN